jgi:hypothetical protein
MRRLVLLALVVPLLAACGSDQDDYCGAVTDHQKDLTEIVASGKPDAMLKALAVFKDLQSKAPTSPTTGSRWSAASSPSSERSTTPASTRRPTTVTTRPPP